LPKPPSQPSPDPMSGVVDRLLAQLPGLQNHRDETRKPVSRMGGSAPVVITSGRDVEPEPGPLGMWIRVLLGLSLAVTMGWWPYSRACGLPLFSYLGAVCVVLVTGLWAAVAAWRNRDALAHVISLTLIFYGSLLAGSELLPRTGYAVQQATWTCDDDLAPPPSIVLR
jgi:hypothetical protein